MVARAIASIIAEELCDEIIFEGTQKIIILPIPMSTKRIRQRGYNQTELIGNLMSKERGDIFSLEPNVLKKIKHTNPQTSLKNKKARLNNLRNSFVIEHSEIISGKMVLILDDVTTTGATLKEVARVCETAHPRRLFLYAIAH